ncbi:TetR family transcriptional regulator [Streptomyces anthocyanicus]|uniref:TetR/AcrR family transcriptional regulator n=1 Tax=Streptomyces anthocyanicus TaxID=68174 RepID=A0ABZ1M384_9ACTN|nr:MULTISPECIES: TetR/AcrR family transcriptional regulator [Streptomyces]MBQ0951066.1 TetR/AcrR family transcriptional regulator [Streptomyces sp. RK76]MDX3320036.1 TetR/AcrR family transcriptional regulator [Streptomyces sp. ME03-5684b]PSK60907.1 HTH-type transcriptional repressor KstR2 [Streptomyces sp. 111WW2]REH22744.1 TetR family transcriptional regulator [Streptomyces sp. 2221.1]WTC10479.1 TetR/AcrR family transcriptional regulator [Streptomyces anthocyanicus]
MSPKQHRGEVTSDLLLDAALRVYADAGEQGLTVSAVTRASGVSLGSLYHHFGSIDGLVNALLTRWLGRLLGELADAVGDSHDARTGVRALVRAYLGFVQAHPDVSRLLHSSRADQVGMEQGRELRDVQEARMPPLTSWVLRHVERGEIAPLSPALLESLLLGPVVGVSRRWLTLGDVDLDEAARILPERIWRSISADGA